MNALACLARAEARWTEAVEDWAARGYVHVSDVRTGSTLLLRLSCPWCNGRMTYSGLNEHCAQGCGWERIRKEERDTIPSGMALGGDPKKGDP